MGTPVVGVRLTARNLQCCRTRFRGGRFVDSGCPVKLQLWAESQMPGFPLVQISFRQHLIREIE
jgi:hypothetical protein